MLNGKRKFILASFGSVSAAALCWFGHVSGAEWVTVQGLILSLHGASNVIDKKLGGAG